MRTWLQRSLALMVLALGVVACSRNPTPAEAPAVTPAPAATRSLGPGAAHRLALVIGNDSYRSVAPLHNARSDARAVARALRSAGFTVTLEEDLALKRLKEALRTFKAQISGGDEAVFYFSGHGVQFEGTNYLIPTDLVPQSPEQVVDESVPLQRVLDDLRDQKARFALAIVDACRDNPFKGSGRAIGGRGLAPVTAVSGEMVMYSAGAGQEALDRLGPQDTDPNGVFTRVLIKEISKPGQPADQVLKHVKDQVVLLAKEVNHEQVPALYDNSIGEFYFVPPERAASSPVPVPVPVPSPAGDTIHVQTAGELEQSFWNRIKDSSDAMDFRDYRARYPQGPHIGEAVLLLRKLDRAHKGTGGAATVPSQTSGSAEAPASAGVSAPASTPVPGGAVVPAGASVSAGAPVPRGTFRGYLTSSLSPGKKLLGRMVLASNGDFEYTGNNYVKAKGNLDLSNPEHVEGNGTVTQPKFLGVQVKYPDGSPSTRMMIHARITHGELRGQFSDKFETGEMVFDLSSPQ